MSGRPTSESFWPLLLPPPTLGAAAGQFPRKRMSSHMDISHRIWKKTTPPDAGADMALLPISTVGATVHPPQSQSQGCCLPTRLAQRPCAVPTEVATVAAAVAPPTAALTMSKLGCPRCRHCKKGCGTCAVLALNALSLNCVQVVCDSFACLASLERRCCLT